MATGVKGNYLIMLRKKRDLQFPITGAGTQSVNEQNGMALSVDFVVKIDVTNV
jgi:hypothetical protein